VDRAAFGSDALTRFLQVAPDSFPVNPPVAPPLPDEFRMVYLNMNELDGFKLAELLMFVALEAVDCMVVIDVRVAKKRVSFLRREARAHLGPRAECLVSVPEDDSGKGAPPHSIKVGGNAIILNNRWGPQLAHYKSDPLHLSVVNEAILTIPGGRLQVLATYWPFPPAHSPVPPEHTPTPPPPSAEDCTIGSSITLMRRALRPTPSTTSGTPSNTGPNATCPNREITPHAAGILTRSGS